MLTVNMLQFLFSLIIANLMLKMLAIWTAGTPIGNAIAFVG